MKLKLTAFFIGLVYFILLFVTMKDYNIFWDARNHYFKGQAFVNYFLSGRTNYKGLPITKDYLRYYRDYVSHYYHDPTIEKRVSKDPNYRRSIYQDDVHTFDWLIKTNFIEHPVFSDIMSAFSNKIFYEKLGWLRDDYSYRVYTIFLAAILVAVMFYWSYTQFGLLGAAVTTLVLSTTPLFWAESHFNLKDVPEMTFFTLAIWQFYTGVTSKKKKNIIFSALFAAFAFGTKLNIVFLPFIVGPWFLIYYVTSTKKIQKLFLRWWYLLIAYPVIVVGFLYLIWPQLWHRPVDNFIAMIKIYEEVGVLPDYTPAFRTIFNFSTYAVTWIFYSTYPLFLILGTVGIVGCFARFKKSRHYLPLLLLLWLFVPIIRASLPFTSIFGGVRHIMEYIPAFSLLAGFGIWWVTKRFSGKIKLLIGVLIVIASMPLLLTLKNLHPAENVYFNFFIGGLSGAKKTNITGWGYNDGGIYRVATQWLNQHADKNAHVAVGFSEDADFYIPELRTDLLADNRFSGSLQQGEYIVGLTHDSGLEQTYRMRYPQNVLTPVFVWNADGVPLIKIWKNDASHVKKEIQAMKKLTLSSQVSMSDNQLVWDLGAEYKIMEIDIMFDEQKCKLTASNFEISKDNNAFELLPETYPGNPVEALGTQPANGELIAPVAALPARYIALVPQADKACIPQVQSSNVSVLSDK